MEDQELADLAMDLVNTDPLMEEDSTVEEVQDSEVATTEEIDETEEIEDTEEAEENEEEEDEVDGEEAEEDEPDSEEEEAEEGEEEDSDKESVLGLDGKEEVDVPLELQIATKDGDKVSVKALLERYEETQKTTTTLEQANQIHTQYREEADKFNENARKFKELTDKGEAQEAINFLCGLANIDAEHFSSKLVSQLAPEFEEFMQLSPEEQEQRQAQQERDFLKRENEALKNQSKTSKEKAILKDEISKVSKDFEMSLDEYETRQGELLQLVDQGRLEKSHVTPKFIGEYHADLRRYEKAANILEEIDSELVKDEVAMKHLVSLQKHNSKITDEDLKARAEKAFVETETKKVQKRVKKNAKATKRKTLGKKQRAAKSRKKSKNDKALTFDDLDFDELVKQL